MAEEMGFHVIDATRSIEQQQKTMREIVMRELGESLKNGILHVPAGGEFSGRPTASSVL
jgi:hypothetical protein